MTGITSVVLRAPKVRQLLILLPFPLLVSLAGWGQESAAPYEIRLPAEIRSDQVQIYYSLKGPFGIYTNFLKPEPERNAYQIETVVDRQAAESLKLILYAPGCQIVTVDVPSLAASEMGSDITCEDLPTVEFRGRVDLPASLRRHPYEVEISYIANWSLEFIHIATGSAMSLQLARVAPDASGAFHLQLPNFLKDAVTESSRRNAGLRFIARELDTGNIVAALEPVNVERRGVMDLPIRPKLPPEVLFRPVPESNPKPVTGETR